MRVVLRLVATAISDLPHPFFQLLHELARRFSNRLAVSEKFHCVHTPFTPLAARYEQRGFLHRFGDLALVEARILAGLAEQAKKEVVFAGVNGLGDKPHLSAAGLAPRAWTMVRIEIAFRLSKTDKRALHCCST